MNTQLKVGGRVKVINVKGKVYDSRTGRVEDILGSEGIFKLRFPDGTYWWVDIQSKDCILLDEVIPTPPTPKWLPIDRDNLPQTLVASINRNEDNPQVYTGSLHPNDANNMLYIQSIGGYVRLSNFTHYIPLTDLLNLPISE